MLDIEVVDPPTQTATDIVSMSEFYAHLKVSAKVRANADFQTRAEQALEEAVDSLHGRSGSLNRMLMPTQLRLWLSSLPSGGFGLPYPDLISVDEVRITETGTVLIKDTDYIVTGGLIAEIHPIGSWPDITVGKRAVSVKYTAGYLEYPRSLKRLIKIKAAYFMQEPEAAVSDNRITAISRRTEFGDDFFHGLLRVPVSYDDWGIE